MPEVHVIRFTLAHLIYSMELEQNGGNAYSYDVYTDDDRENIGIIASGGFVCPDGFAVCLRASDNNGRVLEIVFQPLPTTPPQA